MIFDLFSTAKDQQRSLDHIFSDLSHLRFEEAYAVGEDILAAYEEFYPEYDTNTGVMLLKMGKLALYLVSCLLHTSTD